MIFHVALAVGDCLEVADLLLVPRAFLGAHEAVTQMFSQVLCQSNAALNCGARMSITETAMSDNCCFMVNHLPKEHGRKAIGRLID